MCFVCFRWFHQQWCALCFSHGLVAFKYWLRFNSVLHVLVLLLLDVGIMYTLCASAHLLSKFYSWRRCEGHVAERVGLGKGAVERRPGVYEIDTSVKQTGTNMTKTHIGFSMVVTNFMMECIWNADLQVVIPIEKSYSFAGRFESMHLLFVQRAQLKWNQH